MCVEPLMKGPRRSSSGSESPSSRIDAAAVPCDHPLGGSMTASQVSRRDGATYRVDHIVARPMGSCSAPFCATLALE